MTVAMDEIEIIEIDRANISAIKPLWEQLNRHHRDNSTHFSLHFKTFTFDDRAAQLAKKAELKILGATRHNDSDRELIGFCVVSSDGTEGEIDSLFVCQTYRKKGIASTLISRALNWFEEIGCNKVLVYVAEGNETTLPFYQNFGFRQRFQVLQLKAN